MPTVDLYYDPLSPYCRSVQLIARAVGVDLNLKKIDIFKKEQLNPDFVKINPQHTVPTMVDADHKLWESRAILSYLASKYGRDDTLYPSDPTARSKVDALLYFDIGTLQLRWRQVIHPLLRGEVSKPSQTSVDHLHEALGWLNTFLEHGRKFAAGTDRPTVADFALVALVSSIEATGFTLQDYPCVQAWLLRCKDTMEGYQELNGQNAEKLGELIKSKTTE